MPSRYDAIHVEHLRGARFGLALNSEIKHLKPNLPIVWDSVDCITYLFEQAARQVKALRQVDDMDGTGPDAPARGLAGHPVRPSAGHVSDRQSGAGGISNLRSLVPKHQTSIEVLPNGVDLEYFAQARMRTSQTR